MIKPSTGFTLSESQGQLKSPQKTNTGYDDNWNTSRQCDSCLVIEDIKLTGHKAKISNINNPTNARDLDSINKYEPFRGNLDQLKGNKLKMNLSEVRR
jgi:hypothetical protein